MKVIQTIEPAQTSHRMYCIFAQSKRGERREGRGERGEGEGRGRDDREVKQDTKQDGVVGKLPPKEN